MSNRIILCLELDTVETDSFRPLRERLEQQGISFHSLEEERVNHPDTWLARFAEMDNATRTTDPFAPRSLEEIATRVADLGPEPAGCIVADDGTRLVGYTYFHRAAGEGLMRARQGWTGVRAECRGMGIATALKVEGILLARHLGYHRLVTDPRAENIASVRMSLKVGYRPCDSDPG